MTELRLTDTGTRHGDGLRMFHLELWHDGRVVKSWIVESGQPWAQTKRTYDDPASKPGSYEPIPEGVYTVGKLDPHGGKFDWIGSWGPGIGDMWFGIYHEGGDYIRSAFGFHLDENRASSPGSAGCIVFDTKAEAEDFATAWKIYSFKRLVVDYGFGTVPAEPKPATKPKPAPKPAPKELEATVWINQNGATVEVQGKRYSVFSSGGEKNGALKFKLVPKA